MEDPWNVSDIINDSDSSVEGSDYGSENDQEGDERDVRGETLILNIEEGTETTDQVQFRADLLTVNYRAKESRYRKGKGANVREGECQQERHMETEQEGTTVKEREGATVKERKGAREELRAPDGGWGWMVALGSTLVNLLVLSQSSCFSIMFSQYLVREGISSTSIALLFNGLLFSWHLTMPLVRPLCKEFGIRRVGSFGVTLCVVSWLVSAFASSPKLLYLSVSVMNGVGAGVLMSLAFSVVAPFFDKQLGLANTLMVAGLPLGQIAIAPFVRYLVMQFGFRGAALIYAGVMMNAYVGVALFQPLKWHLKPVQVDPSEVQEELLPQEDADPISTLKPEHHRSRDALGLLSSRESSECERSTQHRVEDRLFRGPISRSGSYLSILSADFSFGVGAPSVISSTYSSIMNLESGKEPMKIKRLWNSCVRVGHSTMSDLSLLRSSRVCVIAFSNMLSIVSFLNFVMTVPFKMQAAGYSLKDSALCITAMGVANLLILFVVSPLADWHRFSIRACLIFGYCLRMVAIIGFSFSERLRYLILSIVVFGLGQGATFAFQSLVVVTYMGVDLLPACFGVMGVVMALGFPCLGPIIGVLRDVTESFLPGLYMMAAFTLTNVALWLAMPVAVARDAARTQAMEEQEGHTRTSVLV